MDSLLEDVDLKLFQLGRAVKRFRAAPRAKTRELYHPLICAQLELDVAIGRLVDDVHQDVLSVPSEPPGSAIDVDASH